MRRRANLDKRSYNQVYEQKYIKPVIDDPQKETKMKLCDNCGVKYPARGFHFHERKCINQQRPIAP